MITEKHTEIQSKAAYKQWAPQWREQAVANSKHEMHSLHDFVNIGIGKACLAAANGYSLEENIDVIKRNQTKVDILCCDKSLGNLLDNDIIPTYCLVCDANVNYEKYLEPYKDKLANTVLLMNVCANPKWADNGNWKKKYFFVNRDVLGSENEFEKLSGCHNKIPAGTNVSNAMVIMLTQSDNEGRRNFFGYDKVLLIGFDYSWKANGKYYAFSQEGDGKGQYMRHCYVNTIGGDFAYTSGNLSFSAQWLGSYLQAYRNLVVCCSKSTILQGVKFGDLEKQMQYTFKPEDKEIIRRATENLKRVYLEKQNLEKQLLSIEKEHFYGMLASL